MTINEVWVEVLLFNS